MTGGASESRRDAADVAWASLVLLAVTSLPYAYGWWSEPGERWFGGIIFNVHDAAQYLSWMRESASRVFIDNKLTGEPHAPVFFHLHWWIAGRAARRLGISLPAVYQLCRLVAVPFYVVVAYWLAGEFFADRLQRRFAFWLATLTSGAGWVWVVEKYARGAADVRHPTDVYTTPGNTFWVLLASPHLAFALALTLLAIGLAWQGHARRRGSRALLAGGVTLFLGLGHVYDLVTVWSVLALFAVGLGRRSGFRWPAFRTPVAVVAISAPAPLYFAWLSSSAHPHWRRALAQFDNLGVFTPAPAHLVVLLGVTFLLAVAGFAAGLARSRGSENGAAERALFLRSWFVAQLVVLYLPLRFQIMLLTGFQFVLAALATEFVFRRLLPWLAARGVAATESRRRWVLAVVLLAVVPTNAYLFAWRFVDLARHDYPFYLARDDRAALGWLEEHVAPDDVVLSALVIGHYVPGLTGARGFLSSAVMTLDFATKRDLVDRFYASETPDAERCAFLSRYGVRWVLAGPAERRVGRYDPDASPFLTPVFATPRTMVYRTRMESCP